MATWKIALAIKTLRMFNFSSDELKKYFSEAEDLIEEKEIEEEVEYQKNWEEDPYNAIERENCLACIS